VPRPVEHLRFTCYTPHWTDIRPENPQKRRSWSGHPRPHGIRKSSISHETPFLLGCPSFFKPSVDIQKDSVGPKEGSGGPELTVREQLERNRPPISSSVPACLGTLCACKTSFYDVRRMSEASQAAGTEKGAPDF
jgi:hypothetical protein